MKSLHSRYHCARAAVETLEQRQMLHAQAIGELPLGYRANFTATDSTMSYHFTLAEPTTLSASISFGSATLLRNGQPIASGNTISRSVLKSGHYTLQADTKAGWPITIGTSRMAAPTRVEAEVWGGKAIHLNWDDNTSGEAQYRVDRWTKLGWRRSVRVGRDYTAAVIDNLVPGASTTYRVSAVDPQGNSIRSANTATATTLTEDTSGWYKISLSGAAKGYAGWDMNQDNLKIRSDYAAEGGGSKWVYASSWQMATWTVLHTDPAPVKVRVTSDSGGHATGDIVEHSFPSGGDFRIGTGAQLKASVENFKLSGSEDIKYVTIEDSYGGIDRDYDDFYWVVEAEYIPPVSKVEFVAKDSPLTPNAHPSGTVGERIFPDKNNAQDATDRSLVKVRATLKEAIEGITVYFKRIDPDDPSTNDSPVDPNGTSGGDNREEPNGSEILTAVTDSDGVAEFDYYASWRPGDNYRFAADTNVDTLESITDDSVPPSDTPTISGFTGKLSPLLTVWRRFNIEVDAMQPGTLAENRVDGIVNGAVYDPSSFTTTITINNVDDEFDENDHFNGGTIEFPNLGVDINVIDTTTNGAAMDLVIPGDWSTGAASVVGQNFNLYDDDIQKDSTGAFVFRRPPAKPDTSKVAEAFADAYIEPNLITSTSSANISFDRNTDESLFGNDLLALLDADRQYPLTDVSDEYISMHLVGAFQSEALMDGDPEASAWAGRSAVNKLSSAIFLEAIRTQGPQNYIAMEKLTVVHEIGHLAGAIHADGGVMSDTLNAQSFAKFSLDSLAKIRSKSHW